MEKKNEKGKTGILYFLGKAADFFIGIGTWIVKATFGDGLVAVGNAITSLKLGEHRWKYYDKEGNPDPKFDPIFPGLKGFLDATLKTPKNEEERKKEAQEKEGDIKATRDAIQTKYESFIGIIPNEKLSNYLKDKLQFIPNLANKIYGIYREIREFIKTYAGVTLLYLNAMFVGILNSILEAIGGIISLVGLILSVPYYLYEAAGNKQKGVHMSFTFELLENALESFTKLFSVKNFVALFSFPKKLADLVITVFAKPSTVVTKFQEGASYIKTHMDNIGYVVGFAIGFIIEQVVTAVFSRGTINVAKALKTSQNTLKSIYLHLKRLVNSPSKERKILRRWKILGRC